MPFTNITPNELNGGVRPWLSLATVPGMRVFTSNEIYQRLIYDQAYFSALQQDLVNQVRYLYELGTVQANNAEGGTLAFHGGHVIVQDGGALYATWQQEYQQLTVPAGQRSSGWNLPSSHYPGNASPQYELRLPLTPQQNWGTVLFGTNNGNSWFQLEAHSGTVGDGVLGAARYVSDTLMHAFDFLSHKATSQQVGPCGYSPHMETANPVVVQL
jgi:hypothetical protein